jgi:hypothetical protein
MENFNINEKLYYSYDNCCSSHLPFRQKEMVMRYHLHSKPKLDAIAHTLTRCGITIWNGIPEQIVKDLHTAGYKIKKRKKFRTVKSPLDIRRVPKAKLESQHEKNDEIYL